MTVVAKHLPTLNKYTYFIYVVLFHKSKTKGITSSYSENAFELRHEKTNVLVSDLVRHKPGCTATEDG